MLWFLLIGAIVVMGLAILGGSGFLNSTHDNDDQRRGGGDSFIDWMI